MTSIRVRGGGGEIPAGKLVCLGRNYAAHARELENEVPAEPVIFLKPASAIIHDGETIRIPSSSRKVHEEVELGVVISKTCRNVEEKEARDFMEGYLVFLDITARDIQERLKEKRLPWTLAKGYDTFAPISEMAPAGEVADPQRLGLSLKVNGQVRQDSTTALQLFKIPFTISHISKIMTLERGDIIATGTPKGVSQIVPGDRLEARVEKVGTLQVDVA